MELGLFWPPCASPDPHPSLFLVSHVHTRELAWRLSVTSLLPTPPRPQVFIHTPSLDEITTPLSENILLILDLSA